MYFDVPHRITGHRGSGANRTLTRAVENTAASCLLAIEHGADSVELDAQVSGDGALVVYHDARTPDGERTTEQPYSQLRRHGIELLSDVMAQLPTTTDDGVAVGVNIEIKTGYDLGETELDHRVTDTVATSLGSLTARHPILLSSFDPAVLLRLRYLRGHGTVDVPLSLITEHPAARDGVSTVTAWDAIADAMALGAASVHLNVSQLSLGLDTAGLAGAPTPDAAIDAARIAGLLLNVWCPEPADAALLLRAGVDGVCVNLVPETVKAFRKPVPRVDEPAIGSLIS